MSSDSSFAAAATAHIWHQRVIFPNLRHGRVVHLSGRALFDTPPKYLHLRGEIIHLYNEDALRQPEVYVTEGILDALSLEAWGLPAVALLGAGGFKPAHAEKFARTSAVYMCLDGDRAGEEGTLKAGRTLGALARIVRLPEGEDVNDLFRAGRKEEFQMLVASAKDPLTFQIDRIPPETPKLELRQTLASVLDVLAEADPATAEAYLAAIKKRFGFRREEVQAYRRIIGERRKAAAPSADSEAAGEVEYAALLDGLVDIVEAERRPAFLLREGERIVARHAVERDGLRYIPPPTGQLPWLLPRAEEVQRWFVEDTDSRLFEGLQAYHRAISELPGDAYYDLLAAWDMHTYLLEEVQYSPMIWLYAVPERGKTRTGKGMIYVAWRGIHVESLRDAYLVRVAEHLRASIFFDVMDLWRKAEREGSEDILLLRFEKGATVPRVLYPDRGAHQDTVYYSVFGPTIIGTNEAVHPILESRAIVVTMPEARLGFEGDVTPQQARPLRERLVAFRARHLVEPLPELSKPARGRLGDIAKPLLQVVRLARPDREPILRRLIEELAEARLTEKSETLEGHILLAVDGLRNRVDGGMLPVKVITDTLNEGRPERTRFSYQRVGRRLTAVGFQKVKTSQNTAAILWDDDMLLRTLVAYGLQKPPETPVSPDARDGTPSPAGVSPERVETPTQRPGETPETPDEAPDLEASLEAGPGDTGVSSILREGPVDSLRTPLILATFPGDQEQAYSREVFEAVLRAHLVAWKAGDGPLAEGFVGRDPLLISPGEQILNIDQYVKAKAESLWGANDLAREAARNRLSKLGVQIFGSAQEEWAHA